MLYIVIMLVSIEWKIKKKTKGKKRKCVSKKKSPDGSLYNEFADRMCDRVHSDLVSLSASMIEVGEELKVVLERWTENRRGWMSEEVCSSVKRREKPNKEYRKMRRVYGVNDERTEKAEEYYLKEKEEVNKIVSFAWW